MQFVIFTMFVQRFSALVLKDPDNYLIFEVDHKQYTIPPAATVGVNQLNIELSGWVFLIGSRQRLLQMVAQEVA